MQLGLTEKVMRDWNTWSSRLPVPSFNDALAKMGDVGGYIQTLIRARQEIINKNYNYHALSSVFAPTYDAQAPIDKEKSSWSRIHDRIYMRAIAPRGALHDGVIQIRIMDDHSQQQHSSNMTLVTETRSNHGAEACAQSAGRDCTHSAFDEVERLAGSRLAQVAVAGSLGPDDLIPPLIAQGEHIAMTRAAAIPVTGPIPAEVLTERIPGSIGVPTTPGTQALTAMPYPPTCEIDRNAAKRLPVVADALTSAVDVPWQGFADARIHAEDTGEPYGVKTRIGKLAMKMLARVMRYTPNKWIRWTAESCGYAEFADAIIANKIKIANLLDEFAEVISEMEYVSETLLREVLEKILPTRLAFAAAVLRCG